MERNRRIHGYTNATFNSEKLAETLQFMRQHGDFVPTAIIIDGMDFDDVSADSLSRFREIAGNIQAELWMSAVTHRDTSSITLIAEISSVAGMAMVWPSSVWNSLLSESLPEMNGAR